MNEAIICNNILIQTVRTQCSNCGNNCEFELCNNCISSIEGTYKQIISFNFEEELNHMSTAISRSLDEMPGFKINMRKAMHDSSVLIRHEKYKANAKRNEHYDEKMAAISIKNITIMHVKRLEKFVLAIDETLLMVMWRYLVKPCTWCSQKDRLCSHLTPDEYEWFAKLLLLSKEINKMTRTFLTKYHIGPVALSCHGCT